MIEDRLRQALAAEAEARDVDVHQMHAELTDRLVPTHRGRRTVPVLAATASLALASGVAVGIAVVNPDDRQSVTAGETEVDAEFTCPAQEPVDLSGAQDEFLPDLLGRTPAQIAAEHDAPRWSFDEQGASATLRLGNDDGTLGSATTYALRDGEWVMTSSVVCGNGSPGAPTADELRLGEHGVEPWPARGVLDPGDRDVEPVFVDDRPVYDYSGLVTRHRSIYVAPCEQKMCFGIGQPDGGVLEDLPMSRFDTNSYVGGELCTFFVPDDLVGRESPYRVLVDWDPTGTSTGFYADPTDPAADDFGPGPYTRGPDSRYSGQVFGHPSWGSGRLWMMVIPRYAQNLYLAAEMWTGDRPVGGFYVPESGGPCRS